MATLPRTASYSDRFLLTIHGITSDNSGLMNLRAHCENALPGLKCDSHFYGYVIPFRDLTPSIRKLVFQDVRQKIELVSLKYGDSHKLFIVAHSFGTLAVVEALKMHISKIKIEGLVLLGSVVPRDHYWDGLIESGQLQHRPLVVVRPLDRVVRLGKWVDGEKSGALGFIANGMHRPLQTYKDGTHTSYYPADCNDVVNVIINGTDCVHLISYDEWYENCGFLSRLRRFLW